MTWQATVTNKEIEKQEAMYHQQLGCVVKDCRLCKAMQK